MKIKQAILIVGMHRSGTSVLARGLQALGVSIGDNLLPGNEWNPNGYFEHADIVSLNDALLGLVGKRWDSLALPPWDEMGPLFESYKAQALALLEKDFAGQALFGIKDPRASRLLPFWQSVFERAGMRDCYVIALRTPGSVARSLSARNGFKPEKSCLLWLQHLVCAIGDTQGKARVVVDYDALMADPAAQLRRIAATLELPVTTATQQAIAEYADGFLAESLRHSVEDPAELRNDPRIGELVARTYGLLRRLARDEVNTPEPWQAFAHEWRALEQVLRDTAPMFHYLDACEDRIDALTLSPAAPASAPQESRAAGPPPGRALAPAPARGAPAENSVPRVSVIIPLYNHEQYVEAAIESVLAQTARPAEIIVIDDGSTDASASKVRRLCQDCPEIIFWSWPNQGAHHTLNAAIHRATGDLVAILNSDDCYHPERLAACLEIVRADPTVDAVTTGVSFVDEQGHAIASAWYEEARAFYQDEGDLSLGLFHANFLLSTSNLFIRRALFESVGYFAPLRYTHDLEFFLRLVLSGKRIRFLDRPLLAYRFHEDNTISENQARVDVEQAAIFAFFLHRHRPADGTRGPWHAWLERYVDVLGRRKLLDLVEYFLALIEGGPARNSARAAESLASEFRALMTRLGVDWIVQDPDSSLLGQLVAARNVLLRRWEQASGDSRIVAAFAQQERNIAELRAESQRMVDMLAQKDRDMQRQADDIHRLNLVVMGKERGLQGQADEIRKQADEIRKQTEDIRKLTASIGELNAGLIERERELANMKLSNWHQLGEALCEKGWTLDRLAKVAYHFTACITPQRWKPALQPWVERQKRRYQRRTAAGVAPQPVRGHGEVAPGKPRVLHVIANFMLGGSSRLVADLIEGLGDAYEQKVVTSHLPSPPAYVGVDVVEFRSPRSPDEVLPFLREYAPAIVHVHYWGDVDWRWYDIFFRAVQTLGCRVIENVNTPVEPYQADFVDRYVHVSDYVRQRFGDGGPRNMTIHPGSDFGLFSRPEGRLLPRDRIGMVYRLESDKLSPQSIDVFVKVAQRRPRTRVIIVGGGTYLEPYRQAVRAAGVADNFEFTGYVEYAKLPALYERMSIFVAPVWKESFGQVSPFAMNLGIPVVGYKVGGLVEIVDDESLLAPPGDSDALADVIIGLLDDPARCQHIGDRNCARARQSYSVEAMTSAYRVLYAELMEAKA